MHCNQSYCPTVTSDCCFIYIVCPSHSALFHFTYWSFHTDMSVAGNIIVSNAIQAEKIIQLRSPEEKGPRLGIVGIIKSPGQDRSSMSWSSDGRFLATSTSEHVSVWRLPAKDLNHANMNIDASLTTSEEVETKKVERIVEDLMSQAACFMPLGTIP